MLQSPLAKTFIFAIALTTLVGCGTVGRVTSSVGTAWDYVVHPPEIGPQTEEGSDVTEKALGLFVYIGALMFVVGVLMCLFSLTRHHGLILLAGGVASALAGHVIEEYAHMVLMSSLGGTALFIVHKISRTSGYELGFERGKDFTETKNNG